MIDPESLQTLYGDLPIKVTQSSLSNRSPQPFVRCDTLGNVVGVVITNEPHVPSVGKGETLVPIPNGVSVKNKRVDVQTGEMEDTPLGEFAKEWPPEKIVEALTDEAKTQLLKDAVTQETRDEADGKLGKSLPAEKKA